MLKILIMSDNPTYNTGQGIAGYNIALALSQFKNQFEIIYFAWGHCQYEKKVPFKICQSVDNCWQTEQFFDQVIRTEQPDIVITISDPWMVDFICDRNRCKTRHSFRWIAYMAVEGLTTQKKIPGFWNNIIYDIDNIIVWTEYGKTVVEESYPELKNKIEVISLGYDNNIFKILNKEEKLKLRKKYNIPQDKFLYLFVGRNQPRKNIPELFKIWYEYIKQDKESLLWPHFNFKDPSGYNCDELLFNMGMNLETLKFLREVAYANNTNELVSNIILNEIYNIADCFINISAEGFGLPIIEAMANKIPCLLLNHSASAEHLSNGRAIPLEPANYFTGARFTEIPIPDIKSTVKIMLETKQKILNNNKEIEIMKNSAYIYASQKTWDSCIHKWLLFFNKICNPLSSDIILEDL